MRQAIVSVEDQRFFEHDGIDLRGVGARAVGGHPHQAIVEGGSTITQQFVKNAYIRNERTLARKVREAALAWQLEQRWSKDRILTAYLNTIYFGNGAYGIQQASRAYFEKGAKDLELHEAALARGHPRRPGALRPGHEPARTPSSAGGTCSTSCSSRGRSRVADLRARERGRASDPEDGSACPAPGPGAVLRELREGPARREVRRRARLRRRPQGHDDDRPRAPASWRGRRSSGPPQPGRAGGRARRDRPEDRRREGDVRRPELPREPVQPRRAGRAAAGLRVQADRPRDGDARGDLAATELESKQVSIDAGDRIWTVTNYDHTYLGRVSLSRALVSSDNTVYAQLTDLVGPKAIVETAHELGIKSQLDAYFSIGLGSGAVNPLEMARAYATIANGGTAGRRLAPRRHAACGRARPADSRQGASTRTGPLPKQVARPGRGRGPHGRSSRTSSGSGTGRRASIPGTSRSRARRARRTTTPTPGSSATRPSSSSPCGSDIPDRLRPMLTEFGGEPVTGGTLPALIWKEFVEQPGRDGRDDAIVRRPRRTSAESRRGSCKRGGEWQLDNGLCRGARLLVYLSGEGPTKTADCKANEVTVPRVIGMTEPVAVALLAAEQLDAAVAYVPAKPGRLPGLVVNQDPRSRRALRARLGAPLRHRSQQRPACRTSSGRASGPRAARCAAFGSIPGRSRHRGRRASCSGRVPQAGVAAAPGLRIRLVVGDGSRKESP